MLCLFNTDNLMLKFDMLRVDDCRMISGVYMQLCLSVVIAYTILQQRAEAFYVPDLAHRRHFSRYISTTRYIRYEQLKLYSISKEQEQYWKLPRLYVGPQNDMQQSITLAAGARIPLSYDQSHYLTNVMRIFKTKKRKGNRKQQNIDDTNTSTSSRDCIRIFNGNDGEWLARVHVSSQSDSTTNMRSKRPARSRKQKEDASLVAECILQLRTQDYKKDDRPWIMYVPLKNQQRLKNMIEKCVEMGAGQFVAVSSDRMEGGAAMNMRFDKLELQAVEASEQCERLDVPLISTSSENTLKDVKDIVSQWGTDMEEQSKNRTLLICRERGSSEDIDSGRSTVIPVLQALKNCRRVSFLIGPEGGWTKEEEAVFDEVCSKYIGMKDAPVQCVSLGSNVLRAETASMLAIGAWSLMIP